MDPTRIALDHGDTAAQAAHGLGKFQLDKPASNTPLLAAQTLSAARREDLSPIAGHVQPLHLGLSS